MNKCWDCIKKCVEDICMYILTILSFTLKHIGNVGRGEWLWRKLFKETIHAKVLT